MQVLYLGRAPRTKETLPDFREKCRVTRHSRLFRGLTGSQRTPGFAASQKKLLIYNSKFKSMIESNQKQDRKDHWSIVQPIGPI